MTTSTAHLSSTDEMIRNMCATGLCISTAVVVFNPLDCLRIRWQVAATTKTGGGKGGVAKYSRSILRQEGLLRGLWIPGLGSNALGAAMARGIGMGCYPTLRDTVAHGERKTAFTMFLAGVLSGGMGYGLSTPMWQIKTRLQGSAGLIDSRTGLYTTGVCKGSKPLFRNGFEAFPAIMREGSGGIRALYRGANALVIRGALMNSGNTLGYDFAKTYNRENQLLQEGFALHAFASVFAAFLSTTFSIPADLVMTRYQTSQHTLSSGASKAYTSITALVSDIARAEGLRGFFRGWVPLFVRVAPVYILYLPLYEQVRVLFGLGYFE